MSNEKSESENNDLAEKRRISRLHELVGEMDPILTNIGHIFHEVVIDLRCTPSDFYQLLVGNMGPEGKAMIESLVPMMFTSVTSDSPGPVATPRFPMEEVLERLFAEAPKMEGVIDQAPALDCQIRLKSGKEMLGALGKAPEAGMYRFLAVARGERGAELMIEHYFQAYELEYVAVVRAQAKAPENEPRIVIG